MGLGMINPFVSFIMIPIHIKYFAPEEYGLIYLLYSLATFSVMFSSCNLNASLKTFFFDFKEENQRSFVKNTIGTLFLFSFVYLGLTLLTGPLLVDSLFDPSKLSYSFLIPLSIGAFLLRNIVSSYQIYFRNARLNKLLSISSLVNSISFLIFQIAFIVVFEMGIESVFYAMALSNTLALIVIWVSGDLIPNTKPDFKEMRKPLKYGLALLPLFFMEWLMVRGDRLFIQDRFDLGILGQYALTMNIAIILSFITTSFLNASRPELYESFKSFRYDGAKRNLFSLYGFFLVLLLAAGMGLYVLGYIIPLFADHEKYDNVIHILPLGILILFIRSNIRFLYEYYECFKLSRPIVFFTLVNLIVFVSLIYLLPLEWGIKSVFAALLFSNLVCFMITFMYTFLKKA